MVRVGTVIGVLALVPISMACADRDGPVTISVSSVPEKVATSGPTPLVGITDLFVDDMSGTIYAVDQRGSQVMSIAAGVMTTLASSGEGPGEVRRPLTIGRTGDSLVVVDAGNGRLQYFRSDGTFASAEQLQIALPGSSASVRDGPILAFPSMGMSADSLAIVLRPSAEPQRQLIGSPPVPVREGFDVARMKEQLRSGRVPALNRAFSLAVLGEDGSLWLVLVGEAEVRRYSLTGELTMQTQLGGAVVDSIRSRFLEASKTEEGFVPLFVATDAVEVEGDLWVLLKRSEEEPETIAVVGADGAVQCHLIFPEVSGAEQFAVSPTRDAIYFGIQATAEVVRTPLPESPCS